MVTEAIVSAYAWFAGFLGGLIHFPDVPAFVGTLSGYASTVGGYVAGTGSWFPWSLLSTVIAAYGVCLAAGLAVKLVRIVASFVTLGGGSAA